MPTFDFAAISRAFPMEGEYRGARSHGNGHIHDTFLFTCDAGGRRYLVQRINERVFLDPERVMQNISIVTSHLHATLAARGVVDRARRVLTPVQSREDRLLHRDASGCWRAFDFIEGTHGFDRATGESMAYEAARAFGEFARDLANLPPERLTETLPAFHHTPTRYLAFERALGADAHRRARQAGPEIAFARARRALAEIPSRLVREGQIPWRVTHNDTKLDNVLFDKKSGAALCVVDLDTVMPGLSLYDFGDLVRSAAHRAAEDTTDLNTVGIEIPLFAALVAGYLAGTGGCLTPGERDHLGFAGQIVALETGLRFLTDYLQGDVYFKTDREHHNLERCRVQFRLVESIEAQMAELEDVVRRAGAGGFVGVRQVWIQWPPGQSEVITMHDGILVGKGEAPQHLLFAMANRHGLIAGATGTGKTVSVRVLAEGLARGGVAVFLADVKGDLSGIGQPALDDPKLAERAQATGVGEFVPAGCPVVHWDIFGKKGHPIRTTISEMGPFLLARLLSLTPAQEGALNIAFRIADEEGLLLLDLKDLRAMLDHTAAHAAELTGRYGNVGKSSVGAIQRQLLVLEQEGGEALFGEPAFDIQDLMATYGQGSIHLLAAADLIQRPRLYATFLLALLSEIFEELPEAGDLDRPKLVFFFDEAHLLFGDAPKALLDKIEQVVRLIRSKGVGVYFISQSPLDIPEAVLGQLGNRIQHALRAFTPRDQKAVRAAAETFRANPGLDVAEAITELAVGEALVSMLDENGVPTAVERARIRPPASRLGPATPSEIAQAIANGPLAGKYEKAIDRESAHEHLRRRAEAVPPSATGERKGPTGRRPTQGRETAIEALAKGAARSIGSTLGRQIVRGVLGAILRGR